MKRKINEVECSSDSASENDVDDVILPEGPMCEEDLEGGRSFYRELSYNGRIIKLFDDIKVMIEDADIVGDKFAYAQIIAIYQVNSQMKFELRWYYKPEEIKNKKFKRLAAIENELFESDLVDDAPADSFISLIKVEDVEKNPISSNRESSNVDIPDDTELLSASSDNDLTDELNTLQVFKCRFMTSNNSLNLISITRVGKNQRGTTCSKYAFAYNNQNNDNANTTEDPFSCAIRRLHLSAIPSQLPCREKESLDIQSELREGIKQYGGRKPLYISGLPGTGKTATVLTSIEFLKKEMRQNKLNEFQFVEINCLRLANPNQAYTSLWNAISGEYLHHETAKKRLITHFNNTSLANRMSPNSLQINHHKIKHTYNKKVIVCLVDEVDFLLTRDDNIIYHFLSWPLLSKSQFVLICVANIMDLPERLNDRLTSRLSGQMFTVHRIVFQCYTHEEIQKILTARLEGLRLEIFDKSCLAFAARKASVVTSDIRTALNLCKRAIEIHQIEISRQKEEQEYEQEQRLASSTTTTTSQTITLNSNKPPFPLISKATINIAAAEYASNPLMQATNHACLLDKAIFISMCKYGRAVSEGPITIRDIWERLGDTLQAAVSTSLKNNLTLLERPAFRYFREALDRLVECGLLKRIPVSGHCQLDDELFATTLPHSDIMTALKDHPYIAFA